MKALKLIVGTLTVLMLSSAVVADWDPGDPFKMHFPQLPDLLEGLDVLAGPLVDANTPPDPFIPEKFLADDWLCTESGPVTGIHFWGSYLGDQQLMTSLDPNDSLFSLVIYEDIPATPTSFSMPGQPLWDTYVQPSSARLYATADEDFYDPNTDEIIGSDTEVWQFNFDIRPDMAFQQTEGEIYWLGIHHTYDVDGNGVVDGSDFLHLNSVKPVGFGWKTSQDHFNDDGVWTDVSTAFTIPGHVVPGAETPWSELIYPSAHPFGGQSIDLAFVIVPEPAGSLLLLMVAGLLYRRRK
jgi:hypothetical protein